MYNFIKSLIVFFKFSVIIFLSVSITEQIIPGGIFSNTYTNNIMSLSISLFLALVAFVYLSKTQGNKKNKLDSKDKIHLFLFAPISILLIIFMIFNMNGNITPKNDYQGYTKKNKGI